MTKRKLDQYRGPLSLAQIAEGMNAALENAARLARDARLLMENGRMPSAVALAILSIEESGKVSILRQHVIAESDAEMTAAWKSYRSHTSKNVAWILGQLAAKGARRLDDLLPIMDPNSDHPALLDKLKQLSIYTDCLGAMNWSNPANVELRELAPYLLPMAEVFARARRITETELELWRKHLLPVKHLSLDDQKEAVNRWFGEMAALGLADYEPEDVAAFLRSGDVH